MPQGEQGANPRLCPPRFDRANPPAPIRIACPIVPELKVETPKPSAIEFGVNGRTHLDATEKFRQLILRLQIESIAGGGSSLVQAHEGKIRRIEKVANRVPVFLDEGIFTCTVASV